MKKKIRSPTVASNKTGDDAASETRHGWFKASRHPDGMELLKSNPCAFSLSYVIARRARWRKGFNPHSLELGESWLGDYKNYGMTEQQYRTGKTYLQKYGFATFRTTNRGTVGKLLDSRLFSIIDGCDNEQNNRPTTSNGTIQSTTNQEPRAENLRSKEPGKERAHTNVMSLSSSKQEKSDMEAECWVIAEEDDLCADWVEAFIDQHNKDDWMIPNRRTGLREPIKHLKKALCAFCEKLENDRCRR